MWDLRKPEGNVYCLWLPWNASNTGLRNNYFIHREIYKHSNMRLFRCSWLSKGSTNIKLDLLTVGKFCFVSRAFGSVVDWVSVHPACAWRLNHGLDGLSTTRPWSSALRFRKIYILWLKIPGGEGTPRKIGWGVCGPLPKTLTLFMTKICDIPYPIYDLTFKSKPSSDQC